MIVNEGSGKKKRSGQTATPGTLLVVIILLRGCGLLLGCGLQQGCGWMRSDETVTTQKDGAEAVISPAPVSVARAITQQASLSIPAIGSFIAFEVSDIAPEIEGRIVATPVDIGDFVGAGAVIARLDDRDAQLRLRQAQASERQAEATLRQAREKVGLGRGGSFNASEVPEVRAARRQYEAAEAQAKLAETNAGRYAKLLETGDVARSAYDEACAQAQASRAQANAARQQYEAAINTARQNYQGISSAQAALEGARAQTAIAREALGDTVVKAPFAGYISDRPAAPGEHVTPSIKIATIQRINPIKLRLQLPEADAGRAGVGTFVTATVAAYPQREFSGRVTAINPAIDPASRAISIEVQIDNPNNLLRPGMFSTAQLFQPGGEEAVFVPRSAVINDPATNSSRVYALEGDVARVRVVQTGTAQDDLVRITSGLSGGETVITNNLDQLFDGAKVIVANL
ncbi:MAG: efflux RND transporter periplasmic adaptor subunit [Blastocatellales bacterium]